MATRGVVEADGAAVLDHDVPVVQGVLELGQAGIGARRGGVDLGGGLHAQGLVRALVVELLAEAVEAPLLLQAVLRRRPGGRFLQREVHALVGTVLLRAPRLDALDADAEPEPPKRERGEAVEPVRGGERHPIVGADRRGQAALLEQAVERGDDRILARRLQRLAHQQIARDLIGDGERIAPAAVAEAELALEVGAPQIVGRHGLRQGRAGGARPPGAGVLDQAVAVEHGVDGRARRHPHPHPRPEPPGQELARAMRAPQCGLSRLSATICASTGIGSRLALRPGVRGRSPNASSPCSL